MTVAGMDARTMGLDQLKLEDGLEARDPLRINAKEDGSERNWDDEGSKGAKRKDEGLKGGKGGSPQQTSATESLAAGATGINAGD
ncbi:hypothetical protein MLD38_033077 [Melastoma candidum]|uniref:Uncharacterized protein n=1 Tax=Melastoma candidum TaxID=119954 RepID=A0ACB9M7P3_9MYRT|nr:hypothetical protein MLD38_033077 [Melastoma candidum]